MSDSNDKICRSLVLAGDISEIRRLIVQGAAVQGAAVCASVNVNTNTPLLLAADAGHADVVAVLLDSGADVDCADDTGWTALMWASFRGHEEIVTYLLDRGANPNKTSSNGWSALMSASYWGIARVVKILLWRDDIVDTTLCNNDGDDWFSVAKHDRVKCLRGQRRAFKEKERLIEIGLGFCDKQLPVHVLVLIYGATVVFESNRVSLINCWEILKLLKKK